MIELQEQEALHLRRIQGYVAPLREDPSMTAEELEAERAAEQEMVDSAEELNEEEIAEKETLNSEGFGDWNKREYQGFIRGCESYGR